MVIAPTEAEARKLAQEEQDRNGGIEGRFLAASKPNQEMRTPWLSPEYTNCEVIAVDGPPKVAMINFTEGDQ